MAQWVKALQMNGRLLVQAPLGAPLDLGTQPRYQAFGDLQVETSKMTLLTLGE